MDSKSERMVDDENILEEIRNSVANVLEDYDVVSAYLYGSFAREEQTSESDVDVAVYFKDYSLKKLLEVSRRIQEEADVKREIDVRALNNKDPEFQFRVIQEGIVLYESSPEERADVEVRIDRRYHDTKPHLEEHRKQRRKKVVSSG